MKEFFESYIDEKYRSFHLRLIPGYPQNRLLGVRVPVIRKLAKQIAKEDAVSFLEKRDFSTYEDTMLYGMVIGYAKLSYPVRMYYLDAFLPQIDNWAVCDCVCSSMHFFEKEKEDVLSRVENWISSGQEYIVRFGIVTMLDYFLGSELIDRTLEMIRAVPTGPYYIDMALAWLCAECCIRYPACRNELLASLPEGVRKKTERKIKESLRTR